MMLPCVSRVCDSSVGHLVARTVGESSASPTCLLARVWVHVGTLVLCEKRRVHHVKNSQREFLGDRDANHEHLKRDVSILSTRVGTERRQQGTTTVPCGGDRAGEWHRIIAHGASDEFGTDAAVSARVCRAHGRAPVVGANGPTSKERNGSSRLCPRMGRGARVKHGNMCKPRR